MTIHPTRAAHLRKALLAATGLTVLAGVAVPSVARAEVCVGKTIFAQSNGAVLFGTCGNDLFKLGKYQNVTVFALDGDDDVRAGFGGGMHVLVLGNGNDSVSNGGEQRITAYGEAGNDTIEGSRFPDVISGGAGTDTVYTSPGDIVLGAEIQIPG